MATLYSTAYLVNPINSTYEPIMAKPNKRGETITMRPTFTLTAVLAAADVVNMCPVPPGAKLVYLAFTNPDLDSGTTITVNVGNTASATVFASASTAFQSAGTTVIAQSVLDVANNTFSAGDAIKFTIAAGPSTASTGTIDMIAQFYMP